MEEDSLIENNYLQYQLFEASVVSFDSIFYCASGIIEMLRKKVYPVIEKFIKGGCISSSLFDQLVAVRYSGWSFVSREDRRQKGEWLNPFIKIGESESRYHKIYVKVSSSFDRASAAKTVKREDVEAYLKNNDEYAIEKLKEMYLKHKSVSGDSVCIIISYKIFVEECISGFDYVPHELLFRSLFAHELRHVMEEYSLSFANPLYSIPKQHILILARRERDAFKNVIHNNFEFNNAEVILYNCTGSEQRAMLTAAENVLRDICAGNVPEKEKEQLAFLYEMRLKDDERVFISKEEIMTDVLLHYPEIEQHLRITQIEKMMDKIRSNPFNSSNVTIILLCGYFFNKVKMIDDEEVSTELNFRNCRKLISQNEFNTKEKRLILRVLDLVDSILKEFKEDAIEMIGRYSMKIANICCSNELRESLKSVSRYRLRLLIERNSRAKSKLVFNDILI